MSRSGQPKMAVPRNVCAAKESAGNIWRLGMNSLLAFLFSFLLFADTPVIADKSVTIDKSAVDKAVTRDKSAIADKSVTADPPLSTELPRIMHFQAPSYPEVAWQEKVHGKVVLKILVYKDGR